MDHVQWTTRKETEYVIFTPRVTGRINQAMDGLPLGAPTRMEQTVRWRSTYLAAPQ